VKNAIEGLPEQYRMAVLLADVEGFSYQEIADILDVPIGTVMSRIHRGRKKLEKQLYEYARAHGFAADDEDMSGEIPVAVATSTESSTQ